MLVRFQNLSIKNKSYRSKILKSINKIFDHGRMILGPEVDQLENNIAKFCKSKYAIGVSSGTDALYLALLALGIGKGDEVITSPLSWVSSTNAIAMTGAKPVFVDIKNDLNLDEDKIEKKITNKTKAILPIHFTGKMCEMDKINKIAKKHKLKIIEDSAQSFGSKYKRLFSGTIGDIGCFSLNPMKVLNSFGEAGAIVTNNYKIAKKIKILRYAGTVNKENCYYPSLNFKIDTFQAAILNVNLKDINKKINKRQLLAKRYQKNLSKIVECPDIGGSNRHSLYSYTILVNNREKLIKFLKKNKIETKIQHPILINKQKAYKLYERMDLQNANKIVKKILCIPIHNKLTINDIDYVSKKIKEFYEKI